MTRAMVMAPAVVIAQTSPTESDPAVVVRSFLLAFASSDVATVDRLGVADPGAHELLPPQKLTAEQLQRIRLYPCERPARR